MASRLSLTRKALIEMNEILIPIFPYPLISSLHTQKKFISRYGKVFFFSHFTPPSNFRKMSLPIPLMQLNLLLNVNVISSQ